MEFPIESLGIAHAGAARETASGDRLSRHPRWMTSWVRTKW